MILAEFQGFVQDEQIAASSSATRFGSCPNPDLPCIAEGDLLGATPVTDLRPIPQPFGTVDEVHEIGEHLTARFPEMSRVKYLLIPR